MSHHFDTTLAQEDPRLNVADMYLFAGSPGNTVMVLTANADAGISAPDTLHEEGIYAFRFHRTRSDTEDLVFKVRFEIPHHAHGDEHKHVQRYRLARAEGGQIPGMGGEVILEGESGSVTEQAGVRAYVGVVPELWAADAVSFGAFIYALHGERRFDLSIWNHKQNYFRNRNVQAIVLEVPNSMIGADSVRMWGNISLYGHAPEVQVSRWGMPLFSHLFLSDPVDNQIEAYHRKVPSQDRELFGPTVARLVARMTELAGSAPNPEEYGKYVAALICPSLLPYTLGTPASFTLQKFNGRPLGDDVLDVMFSLAGNTPIADGVAPDKSRLVATFPYYGRPYDKREQAGLEPFAQHRHLAGAVRGLVGY